MRPDIRKKIVAEYERLDQQLQDLEKAERGSWGAHRTRVRHKADAINAEISKLHAVLYPPVIGDGGNDSGNDFPCRSIDCPNRVDRRTAYDQGGCCDECWEKHQAIHDPPGGTSP